MNTKNTQTAIFFQRELNDIKNACLKIADKYKDEVDKLNPHFSNKTLDYADNLIRTNKFFAVMAFSCLFAKNNLFNSVQSLKKNDVDYCKKIWGECGEFEIEQIEACKKRFSPYYDEIGNYLRLCRETINKYGSPSDENIKPDIMALAAIWAAFNKIDKSEVSPKIVRLEDKDVTTFVESTIGEEFCWLMMKLCKKAGEKVATEARTPLSECKIKDGDKAFFLAGEAWSSDGQTLLAKVHGELPDGEYTIHWDEEGKCAYATLPFSKERFVKKADKTRFIFVLSFNTTRDEYMKIIESIKTKQELTLLDYDRKRRTNKHNMVIMNGEIIAKYRDPAIRFTPIIDNYSSQGRKKEVQNFCNIVEDELFAGKTGIVSGCRAMEVHNEKTGEIVGTTAIITLENVRKIDPESVNITIPDATDEDFYEEDTYAIMSDKELFGNMDEPDGGLDYWTANGMD